MQLLQRQVQAVSAAVASNLLLECSCALEAPGAIPKLSKATASIATALQKAVTTPSVNMYRPCWVQRIEQALLR